MHLNYALVSSFLFVSAVLVYSFDHNGAWGGALYERNPGTLTYVTGTFIVPNIQGEVGSGLVIGVGLDGLTCQIAFLAAGINLVITVDGGVSVTPWGEFWPSIIPEWDPYAQDFPISPGHELRITVEPLSPILAFFSIENFTTDKSWSATIINDPDSPLCQKNAFWAVSTLPNDQPLAYFGQVVFTDLLVKAPGNYVVPRNPTLVYIEQNNRVMTDVQVVDNPELTFIITYVV